MSFALTQLCSKTAETALATPIARLDFVVKDFELAIISLSFLINTASV
jgi:hypothetical protein